MTRYLAENPNVQCDLTVTNTHTSSRLILNDSIISYKDSDFEPIVKKPKKRKIAKRNNQINLSEVTYAMIEVSDEFFPEETQTEDQH